MKDEKLAIPLELKIFDYLPPCGTDCSQPRFDLTPTVAIATASADCSHCSQVAAVSSGTGPASAATFDTVIAGAPLLARIDRQLTRD